MKTPTQAEPRHAPAAWWMSVHPGYSIAARITLVVFGASVAFSLLLAFLAGRVLRADIEDRTGAELTSLATQFAVQLDREAAERLQELQMTATQGALQRLEAPTSEARRLLESLRTSLNFAWAGIADPSGRVLLATDAELEGESAAEEPWFLHGRTQPYLSPVYDVPNHPSQRGMGPRFMDISVPIAGAHGGFVGVLTAQSPWTYDPRSTPLPPTAARRKIVLRVYDSGGRWLLSSSEQADLERVRSPLAGGALHGSARGTIDGVYMLAGIARSRGHRDFPGLGWVVEVTQPASTAYAEADALRNRLLKWGLGLSVILALPTWWLAAGLTRRIRAISATADRIAGGDITAVMPQSRASDEIARMSERLGHMVDILRDEDRRL